MRSPLKVRYSITPLAMSRTLCGIMRLSVWNFLGC